MEEYNTIIIGSGIAGMTSGIYLKRAGINILIIENNMPGGELNKANTIENYPGYESINGTDLAMNIYNQLNSYNPDYLFEDITNVDLDNNIITTTSKKLKYKNLIIATGRRSKTLGLENEDKLIGHGISFCASCDGALYKDKTVTVVGGANTAVSDALYLSKICKKVYIIYRKDNLRSEEILKERLAQTTNVEILYNREITEYIEENNKIKAIKLNNNQEIETDCLFLAIGYIPNSELFNVEKINGYIKVDNNYKTNKKNVYACGDVIKKDLYQLVTSASEGAIAANNIIENQEKGV